MNLIKDKYLRSLVFLMVYGFGLFQLVGAQSNVEEVYWTNADKSIEVFYPKFEEIHLAWSQLNQMIQDSVNYYTTDFEKAYAKRRKNLKSKPKSKNTEASSWRLFIVVEPEYLDDHYVSLDIHIEENRGKTASYKRVTFNFKIMHQNLEAIHITDIVKNEEEVMGMIWVEFMIKGLWSDTDDYMRFMEKPLHDHLEMFYFDEEFLYLRVPEDHFSVKQTFEQDYKLPWSKIKGFVHTTFRNDLIQKYPDINLQPFKVFELDTLLEGEKIRAKVTPTDLNQLDNPIYPLKEKFKHLTDSIHPWLGEFVGTEDLKAIENFHIQNNNPHFKRDGLQLKVRLSNQKIHILEDDTSTTYPQGKSYWYVDYIPEIKCHLIYVEFDERGNYLNVKNYMLIHEETGQEKYLLGIPLFSPNHQYFVTTPYDLIYSEDKEILQIWEVKPDSIVLIGKFSFLGDSKRATWADERSVLVELRTIADEGEDCYRYKKNEAYCMEVIQIEILK